MVFILISSTCRKQTKKQKHSFGTKQGVRGMISLTAVYWCSVGDARQPPADMHRQPEPEQPEWLGSNLVPPASGGTNPIPCYTLGGICQFTKAGEKGEFCLTFVCHCQQSYVPLPAELCATASDFLGCCQWCSMPLPVIFHATVSSVLCHCQWFSVPVSGMFYATAGDFPCHCGWCSVPLPAKFCATASKVLCHSQQSFMHFVYGTELMSLLLWLKMSHWYVYVNLYVGL